MTTSNCREKRHPMAAAPRGVLAMLVLLGSVEARGQIDVLPEIVVTAQKVEQALEDVPLSIGTIDGELIRQSGATGFADLQGYAGNVTLTLSPTGGDFFIRGFGTLSTNAGFEPSVGTVIDGIFYGRSNFLSVFFADTARMEILRGPQGTLFGKNSTAGIFNLVTQAPAPETSRGGELFAERSGDRALRPVLNLPLDDNWSARLSVNLSRNDGLLHNTALDRAELNLRQDTLRLRVRRDAEPWRVDLGGFYSEQAFNANNFQLIGVTAPMRALMLDYDADFEAKLDSRTSANVPSRGATRFAGLNASVDYTLDGLADIDRLRLSAVSAWARQVLSNRDIDGDFSPVPVIRDTLSRPSPFAQYSQELRLSGHDDDILGFGHEVDFVVGGYGYRASFAASDRFQIEDLGATLAYLGAAQAGHPDGNPLLRLGGAAALPAAMPLSELIDALATVAGPALGDEQSATVTLDQRTSTAAVFGQMEYFVLEDWALLLGARLGHERKRGHFTSRAQGLFVPLVADQNDHDSRHRRSENEFSPKLGIKHAFGTAGHAYLSWTRGYKSGGFNALPLNDRNLEFEPEKASSVELGIKTRLLRDSMRVGAALFDMRFDDLQVATYRAGGGGAAPVFLNAAAARSRGAECELQWLTPLPGVAFSGSAGYAKALYTRYPDAPAPATASEPTQDLGGRPLSNAPRWTAAAIPSFTARLPGGTLATATVDMLYRSARYVDVDLAPQKRQRASTEWNTRVVFAEADERWSLVLAARNLSRQRLIDQVLDEPLAPGNYAAARGDRGRVLSAHLHAWF